MSYLVLARKWRPRDFKSLVGQAHVVRALSHALDNDRLHHGFLFTGTRGVGKTTIARILAKCLNCEKGVSSTPCGECSTCREIDEGRFVDLIEVDAASRTKVEETRDLLDNVPYAPARGKYKVYLIDEVHMFSGHSFNALLKTLEEPPPHVKFLLATTDPQKVPVTILSRCLQFNLKRLSVEEISTHLDSILESEGIERDMEACRLLARAADGSVRDALSLLDQAIAYGAGEIRQQDVRGMLGSVDTHHVTELLTALAAGDGSRVLAESAALSAHVSDYDSVLNELAAVLQKLALQQLVPGSLDPQGLDSEALQKLAQQIGPEDVQLYYQIAIHGRKDLPLAPDPRSGFEMTLLRMLAFRPGDARPAASKTRAQVAASAPAPTSGQRSSPAAPPAAMPAEPSAAPAEPDRRPAVVAEPMPPSGEDSAWRNIVDALALKGITRQLALNSVMESRQPGRIDLRIGAEHSQMRSPQREQQLQQALSEYFGEAIKLNMESGAVAGASPARLHEEERQFRQASAEQSIDGDPDVQRLKDRFDAQVVRDTVHPLDQ